MGKTVYLSNTLFHYRAKNNSKCHDIIIVLSRVLNLMSLRFSGNELGGPIAVVSAGAKMAEYSTPA